MKIRVFCLLMGFYSFEVSAQWSDNFSDHNDDSNFRWVGDTSKFGVNTSNELQLNAPAETGTGYLAVNSTISFKATWSFLIRMDFNPSSGNYARVYLLSDQQDLSGPLNGYFLRIGYSNDDLCLYRQAGTTETLIADGRDKIFNATAVNARIKVTRSDTGNWELYCDTTGGENYCLSGEGTDNKILNSQFFGIRCYYTSTRSTKFSFDDFMVAGETYSDGKRPTVKAIHPLDDHRLNLSFSESVDSVSAKNQENYWLENNEVSEIRWNSDSKQDLELLFSQAFTCEENNQLTVKNIQDEWHLKMNDTVFFFRYCTPQLNDIVFNELMIDPTPVKRLPNAEYIELFNRSDKVFNLKDFTLSVGNSVYKFPEMNFLGKSFLTLCSKENQSIFSQFGSTLGLFTSSTALNNEECRLQLKNQKNELISQVQYEISWYDDDFKAQGGWSLEQIDPWNPCGGVTNWQASVASAGGSPGVVNSVFRSNPDTKPPDIIRINVVTPSLVDVYFTEPVDSVTGLSAFKYEVSPVLGHPTSISCTDHQYSVFRLAFSSSLVKNKRYSLTVSKTISDCAGNQLAQEISFPIGIASTPDSADVVINEVLFNARAGGADYIELYNRSSKIINLRNLLIGIKLNDRVESCCIGCECGGMFYPDSYVLISSDIEKVKPFYSIQNENCLLSTTCLPSLDDKSSTLVLLNDTFGKVDEFTYSEKMHVASLKNTEGISLERVSAGRPSWFPENWHSAAENAGYGTPGYINSQSLSDSVGGFGLEIPNQVFSPDNDGYEDVLLISCKFDKPGCRAMATIFDSNGRLVKRIFNNLLMGPEGCFNWDGTDDAGRMCNVGIYIIFFRAVFDDGTVNEYKKTCVLATKR